ncbi:MAG: 30S ribosomal protein S17 [Mycoplasmataceae bacterium]|jgi:small subunit ribosomal protein S17|nr:30S ribosomal protein S17 [Mycoplasmataceae bacterium]
MENLRNTTTRKTFVGTVVSTKMQKTIVVEVETKILHPLYRKLMIRHKKYHVHDETSLAKDGDVVKIQETKPISKTKCYRLIKILEKAK